MTELGYYAYTRPDALASAMDASTTAVVLVDGSTFPDPATPGVDNYTVLIGYGSSREEVCTVVAKPTANTLTVIRHEDGTLATPKNLGDVVVHGVSARDFSNMVKSTDARLEDAREPTIHATSHSVGGTDRVTPASIGAPTVAEMQAAVGATVSSALPVASVIMWMGPYLGPYPTGWLLCNGAGIPAQYTALRAIVGTSTPDLRDRFPRGHNSSESNTGALGGSSSVTLSPAQYGMPSHTHTATSGVNSVDHVHAVNPPSTATTSDAHSHSVVLNDGSGTGDGNYVDSNVTNGSRQFTAGVTTSDTHNHTVDIAQFNSLANSADHTHVVTVAAAAAVPATQPVVTVPPYVTINFLIKAV